MTTAGNKKKKSAVLDRNDAASNFKEPARSRDDLETCVETEIGTDLGTDFVNVFFQKTQQLKEKQKIKAEEIRKSVASHAFPIVNDSEDDFTVVSALKSSYAQLDLHHPVQKPPNQSDRFYEPPESRRKHAGKTTRMVRLSTSDDEDSTSDFNVFRKSRKSRQSKTKVQEEEEMFNKEFEVAKSLNVEETRSSVSDAKNFFDEVDTKYKSSTKESTQHQERPQQMVKACPECGEVNKVYVTWCVECGGVLSEVKPVPFMPKKSHTPREAVDKVVKPDSNTMESSAAQEIFKIKLENSFNEPRRSISKSRPMDCSGDREINGTANIRDSDNFEYEQIESPVRSLPDPLKRVLSLDLRTSTDSSAVASSGTSGVPLLQGAVADKSADSFKKPKKSNRSKPGVHNELVRMSENIDFVYNEAESPKKSFPHALQRELSLELSLDSDSSALHRINAAGKVQTSCKCFKVGIASQWNKSTVQSKLHHVQLYTRRQPEYRLPKLVLLLVSPKK